MLTKLFLTISKLPAWIARAKREHLWLYAEIWAFVIMLGGILINLFSFRSDDLSAVFMIGVPGLWIILQPFALRASLAKGRRFGLRAAVALPLWAMLLADAAGMLAIAVGRDAFVPAAFDVFYLLVLATALRIPILLLAGRPPYRGKPAIDQLFLVLSYALSVILYALSVTL